MRHILLPVAICFFATAFASASALSGQQGSDSGTSGRRFHLSDDQLQRDITSAKSGDTSAISRLSNHYQWAVYDQAQAVYWLRKGAQFNDPWAMVNLASILGDKDDQGGCREAEKLLIDVAASNASPELKAIAGSHLETLRMGFEGFGTCVKWLKPQNTTTR